MEIAVIDIVVVVVGHHSARTDIGIPGNDGSIRSIQKDENFVCGFCTTNLFTII